MKLTRLAAAAGLMIAVGVGGVAIASPAAAYPAGTRAEASINKTVFAPGDAVSVTVTGATPGGTLTMVFQSDPIVIASGVTVTAASPTASNPATISGTIPKSAASGAHTIRVTSTTSETFEFGITVTGGSTTAPTTPPTSTTDKGSLASTGAAVTGIGVLGGLLVAGGVFFVVAGRRRTTANHTPSV